MRRAFFVTLALAATTLGVGTAVANPARPTRAHAVKPWTFDEEFNGTTLPASLNPSWYGSGSNPAKPPNGSMTMCTAPSHATVAAGYLDLRLTHDPCTVNGHTYPYTGASVDTRGKVTFRNATIKLRVFIDGDKNGVWQWPVAWSDGTGTWPHTGEADWAEGLNGHLCFYVHVDSGAHGNCAAGNYVGWVRIKVTIVNGLTTVFYNGKQVGQQQNANADQYVVLGAQSGPYGGADVTPDDLLVDYLRIRATS